MSRREAHKAAPAIGVRRSGARAPGRGKVYPDGSVRIVIGFDEDTFAEVRALALKEKTCFAEQVRQLVEEALLERTDAKR